MKKSAAECQKIIEIAYKSKFKKLLSKNSKTAFEVHNSSHMRTFLLNCVDVHLVVSSED